MSWVFTQVNWKSPIHMFLELKEEGSCLHCQQNCFLESWGWLTGQSRKQRMRQAVGCSPASHLLLYLRTLGSHSLPCNPQGLQLAYLCKDWQFPLPAGFAFSTVQGRVWQSTYQTGEILLPCQVLVLSLEINGSFLSLFPSILFVARLQCHNVVLHKASFLSTTPTQSILLLWGS